MVIKYWIVALVSLAATTAASAQPSDDWSEAMDAIFVAGVEAGTFSGTSVVVIENGKIAFTRAYGVADADGNPFTTSTRSYLGSVSKSFVGLATVMLAAEGKLDLDQAVTEILPDFRVAGDASAITIRHLLNHTSGFSTYTGNRNQTDQDLAPSALARTVADLADWPLDTPPGTRFAYSNANYQTLGRVIEVVTGKPFSLALHDMIFAPLKMRSTQIGQDFGHPDGADGFRFWGTARVAHQDPMGASLMPQGGVSSTALDMGNYLIALSGGNGDVPNVWNAEIANGHNLPDMDNYAAGWMVHNAGEDPLLVHSGLNGGFTAVAAVQPAAGKGVAVITNTSDGFIAGDVALLHNQALQAVFPQLPAQPVDFGSRYAQAAGMLAIIIGIIVWILIVKRNGIPPTYFTVRLIVPTALLLLTAYAIGIWLPQQFGIPLQGISVFFPDVGLLLTVSAGLPLVWAILRFILVIQSRQASS